MSKYFVPTARPAGYRSARRADDGYGETAQPDWRGIDWLAAHAHRARSTARPVNYVDIGSGEREPIVFVHGLGGQWQNWLENIPRAARERRVVALDLPGFGASPMPRERITISGYGRVVDALCEQLGLGRVDVVGNSMGGFIAAEVAIQFPQRVDQLLLVSAAGITTADLAHAPVLTVGRVMAAIVTWGAARHRHIAARPRSRHTVLQLVARHPSLLKADLAYEGFFKGAGKPGFEDALRACLDYDFRDRLPEIGVPDADRLGREGLDHPGPGRARVRAPDPGQPQGRDDDTGHVAMVERPAAFNDVLMEFLGERGPAAAKQAVEGESAVR